MPLSSFITTQCGVIILAGGFSTRMQALKPLLALGETTVLGHVAALWRQCGVQHRVLISGHAAQEITAEASTHTLPCVHNAHPEQGMFSSVRTGLAHLYNGHEELQWFFVHPVDIPLIQPETIRSLMETARHTNAEVIIPSCNKRRGHPPALHRSIVPHILHWGGENGLRGALRQCKSAYLETTDQGVLWDMDTPEDYARILKLLQGN